MDKSEEPKRPPRPMSGCPKERCVNGSYMTFGHPCRQGCKFNKDK